jgi:AraC-like DNA-binding protein
MAFVVDERSSDSPYVESIMHGYTVSSGTVIRPAECHWHMVFTKYQGRVQTFFVAPLKTSGQVSFTEGAEILWIKFKLGTFMPHLPARKFLDTETTLPEATNHSFWLKGSTWQLPHYENVETFIKRLRHDEILVHDPIVEAVLQDQLPDISPRTLRHRFLQATGLTHTYIRQAQRAQQAAALLRQGLPILDTTFELGYFDQPHLTRSLKRFIGYTPAQLAL